MALSIISPSNSFLRFGEAAASPLCIWGTIDFCLPVYNDEDIYFQFIIQGTELEIDSLCTQDMSEVEVALVTTCNTTPLKIFTEKPTRSRLSPTQVLYNWQHGLPEFGSVVEVNECFKIQVTIEATPYGYPDASLVSCSNCLERIPDDCYTSVVEYSNEDDAFDFKYCSGGGVDGGDDPDSGDCDPTVVTFINQSTLVIPYTALLQAKYGVIPTVQVWIYDGTGQLINMGITAGFDGYPPTLINLDLGGSASGIVVIR